MKKDPCGGDRPLIIENTTYGFVQSPNYPENYKTGLTCGWIIKVDKGRKMKINFIDVQLEQG